MPVVNTGQLILILFSTVITLLLILLLRMLRNGGSRIAAERQPAAEEPGKGEICIERGEKIQKNELELEHLIKDLDEEKEDRKVFRRDISTAIGNVHKELRKMNGAK